MPEPRFLVVAPDATTADLLLGSIPTEAGSTIVYLGSAPDELRSLPCDRIVSLPSLSAITEPAVVGAVLRDLIELGDVVVLDSSQPSRDLAGWLSASLDLPLIWAVDSLVLAENEALIAERVVLGGTHRLLHEASPGKGVVVMVKPVTAASQQERAPRNPEIVERSVELAEGRVRVVSGSADIRGAGLGAARVIVSIGRGVGGPENVGIYRELADRVGAALGASRVAVDSGWVPFAHQVGQTGTTVAADLYVAFGISGAIQHLAGMQASKRIVAVNTDKDAPLCHVADLVVLADANDVADALLKRLAEAGV